MTTSTSSLSDPTLSKSPTNPMTVEEEKELQFGKVWTDAGKAPERPTLDSTGGRRKSSVQFNTAGAEETKRNSITQLPRISITRKQSSPPPAPRYRKSISFDTFDNKDATTESFTLQYKHTSYKATSRSRTFLCGTDNNDYSEYALEWVFDDLVDDGDEIICLRVVEKDSRLASEVSVINGAYRKEAQDLLDNVVKKNAIEQKAISVVLELAVGRVESVIQRMIQLYEPAALVVGTRGRNLGGMQGLLPGSVSKYCLQHSPVPVIVVRPSSKRTKKKQKRQQEAGRNLYSTMLEQAQSSNRMSIYDKSILETGILPQATKQESEAVAKAIGPPKGILRNRVAGPIAPPSAEDVSTGRSFALPIGFLSTEAAPRADLAMKSPIIAALGEWDDSPASSRARSPAPPGSSVDPDSAVTDDPVFDPDDDHLGQPKIIDHRRPSTRETTPWLAQILRQPERPPSRGSSANRTRTRSRSR